MNWLKPHKEMNVLDVGCAWGYFLYGISDLCDQATGIDINPQMISSAKDMLKEKKNISLLLADARDLPLDDQGFDAVVSLGAIEHFPESSKALEEMVRVTKPSGIVVVSVPNAYDFLNRSYRSLLIRSGRTQDYMQKYFMPGTLKKMMADAGLKDIEVNGYGAGIINPPVPGRLKRHSVFRLPEKLHYSLESKNTFLNKYIGHMVMAKGVKKD